MIRGAMKLFWGAGLLFAALPTLAQESHTIRFRALTPEGAPVANALIFWMPYKDELRTTFAGEHERSVTDAEGYCTVDFSNHPDAAGSNFEVCVEPGDGYAGIIRVYPPQKTEDPTVITVEKQVRIHGRVRTEKREAVDGAVLGSTFFPRTTTDDQGRFTIWGLGTGGSLSIFKEGLAWTTINSPKGEMDILLQPGFPVTFEAADADGTPLPAVTIRYRDIAIKTGDDGRAISLPLPRDEDFHVQAWQEGGAAYLSAESQWISVDGTTPQVVKLVLKRRDETPTVSISGRVVMADTGEPVRARIFIHDNAQEFDYYGDSGAETTDDGSFTISNLAQRDHFIQARPTKSTLYGSDGIVRVNCSAGSVDGLELKVAPGCAVSGRIKMSDGGKPVPQWVTLRQGDSIRQFASERGHFQFFNLPPSPTDAELHVGDESTAITLGEAGTALRDVTIALRATSDKARIRGRILNEQGEPQAGLSLSIRINSGGERTDFEHGETNGEGHFEIATVHTGTASMGSISTMRQFSVGAEIERRGFDCPIIDGPESFILEAGATVDDLTYVIAEHELVTLAGTIQDEHGTPLQPEIRFLTGPWNSSSPHEATSDGYFKFYTLPDERFAVSFELKGHQVRILEEGRNFERGDQQLKVVLPTTRYPDDVPMWTTITGAPWTPEAVEQSVQGDPIRQRFEEFKRLLDPASPREATPPTQPIAPEPTSIPLRVLDASGVPIPRILLQPMAHYGHFEFRREAGALDVLPQPGTAPIIQSNAEGIYEVPLHHLIWAEGTCRQLTGGALAQGEASPRDITLYPARKLTVQVRGHCGAPLPRVSLAPYTRQGNLTDSGVMQPFPKTDADGKVHYDGLPPGIYTLVAHPPMQEQTGRLVQADLTENEDVTVAVDFGIYPVDSGDALLEKLRADWQKARIERTDTSLASLWEQRSRTDRKRIQEAVIARLAAPVLSDITDLHFLAELAVAAKLNESVPDLMRSIPYLPDHARRQDGPAIANALADLAGNDAIAYFSQAMNPDLDRETRLSMLVAMNRIGTAESLAAWRNLRDGARSLPNAPQVMAEYTHEERMVEAMRLVLGFVAGAMADPPLAAGTAEVDPDYRTGRISIGNTDYVLRRYGDEWIPVEIGTTVME